MRFLYHTYIPKERKAPRLVVKPPAKAHRKVNFEDMQDQRQAIGKKVEEFALAWEKQRLTGSDLAELIEVKSVAKLREGHRFFLSNNEYDVSRSPGA